MNKNNILILKNVNPKSLDLLSLFNVRNRIKPLSTECILFYIK